MNYLIVTRFRTREITWSRIIWLTFLLAFLCTIIACRASGEPSDEQIERAKKAVSEIRASLYTPDDVELLKEILNYGSNPELYPGCVSGHVYLAFHSPKPFHEILEEYRIGLAKGGSRLGVGLPTPPSFVASRRSPNTCSAMVSDLAEQ